MAGYLSVSFDPSAIQTELNTASSAAVVAAAKASDASSAVAARSAIWDKASAASSAVLVVSNAASAATVTANAASNTASAATVKAAASSSSLLVLASSVIRSIPGVGSRVIKEFVYTAASEIKARISSLAQA